jgi:calmodulin
MESRQKEEELNELREAFACFDKDSDGKITASEIASILQAMNKNVTQGQLEKMIQRYDVNNDGEIDFEEFVSMMAMQGKNKGDELEDAFNVFDKNGDGLISSQELQIVMNALGENISKEISDLMIASVDTDGNGEIDFDEFRVMMQDGAPILSPDESKMIKDHSRLSLRKSTTEERRVSKQAVSKLSEPDSSFKVRPSLLNKPISPDPRRL